MKKMLWIPILAVLILSGAFLYLVQTPTSPFSQQVLQTLGLTGETSTGRDITSTTRANPASRNCESKGGTIEIREGTGGRVSLCHLADGTTCEAQAYMRRSCGMQNNRRMLTGNSISAPSMTEQILGGPGSGCTLEYIPVCANVTVQCATAPCPTKEQTFANTCMMEKESSAKFSYKGVCGAK